LKVIALIDGEHHADVTRAALYRLAREHDVRGALFVGGEEKVPRAVLADPVSSFGRDVLVRPDAPAEGLRALAAEQDLDAVVDLSGEPIIDADARFRLASVALSLGLSYRAPGLTLDPPPRTRLDSAIPVVAVIGTGKRTGKTAVGGHLGALLRERGLDPVIVSMGRGGPAEPQIVRADERPGLERLLAIAAAGGHAASDYLEDAVLAGVTCIGCRRCGEGPAGETFDSNVFEGARLALSLDPGILVFEGSGAALPPFVAHRTVCVTSAARAEKEALAHLGPYRLLSADLVIVVGADELDPRALAALERRLGEWCAPEAIVPCRLEPEPVGELPGTARAAAFATSSRGRLQLAERLAESGVELVLFSANLARREALARDLETAARERCDLFLTELKAAAIDVVAAEASRLDARVAFLDNRPASIAGAADLDGQLLRLAEEARAEAAAQPAPAGRS
jgi:cyclic 2,3-diphosphoglycerate synthetase